MIQESLQNLFWILIFPGFLFTAAAGLLISWVVRKVSALVQYRVGPVVTQPFWDVVKLMGKEVLIPDQANKAVFIGAPVAGLAGVLLLSTMLWHITIWPKSAFIGDLIVVIYLMVLPSLALIFASSASASPHAAIGASREMKLVMSYELPLILAMIVVITKSNGSINLADIAAAKPVASISGLLAFLVSVLCIQAKLGFIPFDIAESETELASGVLIEYSGALLAVWKITQAMMLVALPLFVVMVFLGGIGTAGWPLVIGIIKYLIVVVLLILIKNTNPRVRIDQAMRFFWIFCGVTLAAAVVLAMIGNAYGIGWL
ncbi:MAG: NADH-quinone oxidoreductase subunit H [Candidatus Brocadiia bacterium]|nr:MAG: NADH-quinone oxidoreductase subunit H [Candidatus Brocadiia bacterium]